MTENDFNDIPNTTDVSYNGLSSERSMCDIISPSSSDIQMSGKSDTFHLGDLATSKILKNGDLVKILERRGPGFKPRDSGLGRVIRSIPIDDDHQQFSDGHPFLYDIQCILGGILHSVHRSEILYTTADNEGFTDDHSVRGNRKFRLFKGERPPLQNLRPHNKAINAIRHQRLPPLDSSQGTTLKKDGTAIKTTSTISNAHQSLSDLFDRHKREFEKQLMQLQKLDRIGLFHVDCLDRNLAPTDSDFRTKQLEPTYSLSWNVIWGKHNTGCYIHDRVPIVHEKRIELLQPYYEWRHSMGLFPLSVPTTSENDVLYTKGINWELFHHDIRYMCDQATREISLQQHDSNDIVLRTVKKILSTADSICQRIGRKQQIEMSTSDAKHKFSSALALSNNYEAAMQGEWKKDAYPERKYQRLASSNVLCDGLSPLDQRSAMLELETSLPDCFVGLSYSYDDRGQSEGWMKSVLFETSGKGKRQKKDANKNERIAAMMAADSGVIRAQVRTTMEKLLISVQDRVMTDFGVLQKSEVRSANWLDGDVRKFKPRANTPAMVSDDEVHIINASSNESSSMEHAALSPEVAEQPVWGIDCYTRRNIETCIEADFDSEVAIEFIEKWLLPAINACPVDMAHDMAHAARILEGILPDTISDERYSDEPSNRLLGDALREKIATSGPPWLKAVAHQLRRACESLGKHEFCVHPKGHGSVVISREGIAANTLVTHYRGEVYPPWRWGEKLDAIEQTQNRHKLRPDLPDFYNMALERPQRDPRGYGLLFVDASRKAGLGSSFSHSCDPTCEVKVVALGGKLSLAIATLRHVEVGEELTFDYNAVTESLNEYRAAICLCGHKKCRGSFLHFATADCYQEVLRRNFPIGVRFASLVKGCMKRILSKEDDEKLRNHGFGTAAFGAVSIYYEKSVPNAKLGKPKDSLDNVPVWLLTFAAETLRYIEYERRALPIALVSNHLAEGARAVEAKNKQSNTDHTEMQVKSNYKRELDRENEDFQQKFICIEKSQTELTRKDRASGNCARKRSDPEISFEAADIEGWSSMEQRIHQLVQTLSRVGRVLDRHRESLSSDDFASNRSPLHQLHHPVVIVPDEDVVISLWCAPCGVRKVLVREISKEAWIIPSLLTGLELIVHKYEALDCPPYQNPSEARKMLTTAFLDFRLCILDHLKRMSEDWETFQKEQRGQKRDIKSSRRILSLHTSSTFDSQNDIASDLGVSDVPSVVKSLEHSCPVKPWVLERQKHYKLEVAADLLLLYAMTNTFFRIQPYLTFSSSPINVYARELGNTVPKSVVDTLKDLEILQVSADSTNDLALSSSKTNDESDASLQSEFEVNQKPGRRSKKTAEQNSAVEFCEADDVVTSVTVRYQGDYVLSLLLQWYSGGINLNSGLPDMFGCVTLPSIDGCWKENREGKSTRPDLGKKCGIMTTYESEVRPALISYLEDKYQRGHPWPNDVRSYFGHASEDRQTERLFGSPVLDCLITGDESILRQVIDKLKNDRRLSDNSMHCSSDEIPKRKSSKSTAERLKSTVDEGMPVQCVSKWAQCENPTCLKWRKLPWYVDVDTLSDMFFCHNNIWNPDSNSCDKPEDPWDDADAPLETCKNRIPESAFVTGARFDVQRKGKISFSEAVIIDKDFISSEKRVKFHFLRTSVKNDEWIEIDSSRIAPHQSYIRSRES